MFYCNRSLTGLNNVQNYKIKTKVEKKKKKVWGSYNSTQVLCSSVGYFPNYIALHILNNNLILICVEAVS